KALAIPHANPKMLMIEKNFCFAMLRTATFIYDQGTGNRRQFVTLFGNSMDGNEAYQSCK
ncbi:MAG: hypothetical protein AAF141_12515, partial [Pseudomonadota bacterium]